MKLYILGNGFDVAHGLPTKYSDFKKYIRNNDTAKPNMADELDNLLHLDEGWGNFESAMGNPDKEQEEKYDRLGLINIFNRALQEQFDKWISSIKDTDQYKAAKPIFSYLRKNDLYIEFNYLEVLQQFYNIPITNICHIHGHTVNKSFDNEAKMIFGHGEDARKDSKLAALTYKDTKSLYEKNEDSFEKIYNSSIEEIIVIGFSYSLIDKYYFEEINKHLSDVKWLLNYHTDEDKTRLEAFVNKVGIRDYEIKEI